MQHLGCTCDFTELFEEVAARTWACFRAPGSPPALLPWLGLRVGARQGCLLQRGIAWWEWGAGRAESGTL